MRVSELIARACKQFLISITPGRVRAASERHDDHALEFHPVAEFFVNGQQHVVHDQETVAGMIRDVGDFIGMQAQIQRVQHAARDRHAEISLHVLGLIPQQRGHAVSAAQAKAGERIRQAARAPVQISPSGSRQASGPAGG